MTLPDYLTAAERAAAERFPKDTANHVMTVLHDDGLYRHLRFSAPSSSFYWFEIVTWPGSLVIHGDCGSFTFSRVQDMFTFFRANGNSAGINPGYWAEKLPTNGRNGARKYSEEVFRTRLDEELAEYDKAYPELQERYEVALTVFNATPRFEQYPWTRTGPREPLKPMPPAEVRDLVTEFDDDGAFSHEDGARSLLSQLENGGVLSDVFEWRMDDYTWEFLWNCHAIVWGINQYDAAAAPIEAVAR